MWQVFFRGQTWKKIELLPFILHFDRLETRWTNFAALENFCKTFWKSVKMVFCWLILRFGTQLHLFWNGGRVFWNQKCDKTRKKLLRVFVSFNSCLVKFILSRVWIKPSQVPKSLQGQKDIQHVAKKLFLFCFEKKGEYCLLYLLKQRLLSK